VLATIILFIIGFSYYSTPLTERFYHSEHDLYKPSGMIGHGLGITGTLLIVIGVFSYMARKRYRFLSRFGRLKYWLEFHIFLCILGPIMILYHTAFKFGGIVSISFWSMVVVVASGIIGRYIYLQIPRSMEGRELSLNEVREMKSNLNMRIKNQFNLDEKSYNAILEYTSVDSQDQNRNEKIRMIRRNKENKLSVRLLKKTLRKYRLSEASIRGIVKLIKNEISLNKKLQRLQSMQRLFKYWHIVHLPFALIMLIIMIIHVGITLTFGARWIF
jgi:pheromone shutdown protein TraB